jgi:hypothetical protein
VTVCPYLVFAARRPQSQHDPGEFIVGDVFTAPTSPHGSMPIWRFVLQAGPEFWEACALTSMEAQVREIEVKYRVDDLEALLLALKSRGIELSEPVFQDDQAYAPAGWQFGDSKLGVSFLRLRTVGGRHYFALKQPAENAQACLEHKTEVADRDAMHCAAMQMGFRHSASRLPVYARRTTHWCTLLGNERPAES